jgi:UDP-3-O-[3-hydroxymyristoyl] glucosamine N-acyltransferase
MVYRLRDIAEQFGLEMIGDGDIVIEGLCGLSDNRAPCLSFVTHPRLMGEAASSDIAAFVTRPDARIEGKPCLFHDEPEYAMALIAHWFAPTQFDQADRVHASAVVHETAAVDDSVELGPNAVVGSHCVIGKGTRILANTVILDRVRIGEDCVIHSGCVIREDSVLEDRVILQPGVMIGGDGYGYARYGGRHVKIPHLGGVVLEADVEVGANSTVDRGRFSETRIGRGTKIDNLVMVGHNVQVGEDCLLVAQVGISGSTRLGDRVTLGGQAGVAGHIRIADDVTVLGQAMVSKGIREAGIWGGAPVRPVNVWRKAVARFYAGLK